MGSQLRQRMKLIRRTVLSLTSKKVFDQLTRLAKHLKLICIVTSFIVLTKNGAGLVCSRCAQSFVEGLQWACGV